VAQKNLDDIEGHTLVDHRALEQVAQIEPVFSSQSQAAVARLPTWKSVQGWRGKRRVASASSARVEYIEVVWGAT
jgi:hypothetical protein